ncbi:uncharacterized protein N7487_006407 [Penicillium crustosum]|uniref:uncharacterized protein n=1 Tax=Penicillium crustosum TaxID=36656 RepID=UPI0023A019FF|nr:uncharacterized protein N7487_006407 [Penicillium crustosum]KAJ5412048.1 hypothetical protein N7487_006407 [Penicillium crustosum]
MLRRTRSSNLINHRLLPSQVLLIYSPLHEHRHNSDQKTPPNPAPRPALITVVFEAGHVALELEPDVHFVSSVLVLLLVSESAVLALVDEDEDGDDEVFDDGEEEDTDDEIDD